MARLKRKSISIIARLRNYFFTGIVVLVPIGITLYLTKFFITISPKLIPSNINPNNYMPFAIPGLEILLSVIFITLIGSLSLSYIGKKFLQIFNDLLKKIPILRTIYSAIGQMAEFLAPKRGKKKTVVLVEYPRKGSWAVGFATKDNKGEISQKTNTNLVNVFVPTTPNPTSGFLLLVPRKDLKHLDVNVDDAIKTIVSAGIITLETREKKN